MTIEQPGRNHDESVRMTDSDRKQQEALQESEERFRAVWECAADAMALDFAGDDVVANQGAQALQLKIARSTVHPVDDLIHGPPDVPDRQMHAADHRAHEALHRLRLRSRECRIDDHRESVGLAAVIGVSKHREVIRRNAAISQVDCR